VDPTLREYVVFPLGGVNAVLATSNPRKSRRQISNFAWPYKSIAVAASESQKLPVLRKILQMFASCLHQEGRSIAAKEGGRMRWKCRR
jgi:hypothetical protein